MTIVVGSGTGGNYPITAGALCALEERGMETTGLISTSGSCVPFAFRASGNGMKDFLVLAKKFTPMGMIKPHFNWPFVPGLFQLDAVQSQLKPYVPKDFNSCKIPLTIVTFDSDSKTPFLFCVENTPDAKVPLAVQASMSIPWVMRHVKYNGMRLTDGGVANNFALNIPDEPAVGIRVLGAESETKPWRWWGSYSYNHVEGMLQAQENAHIETALWKKHNFINIKSPLSGMDFHKIDADMVDTLFEVGYKAVMKKLESGWSWK